MSVKIKTIKSTDTAIWDEYVHNHPRANLYHLSGWKTVIEKTYGLKTYYLMAIDSSKLKAQSSKKDTTTAHHLSAMNYELNVVGILPLVHLKHFLFGNSLVSIPFFDLGGILADDAEAENALLSEAIKLGQKLKVDNIELRHTKPLPWLADSSKLKAESSRNNSINYELSIMSNHQPSTINPTNPINPSNPITIATRSHKVRMLLDLPKSSEILMKSFKSKLRSQIKKPVKEGLKAKIGSLELLDDFYKVFLINMRDLGSPVHSKKLMRNVLTEFSDKAKIVIVYKDHVPVACSLIVGFKDTLENPWASALREYSRLGPNMLLYWTMIEYASDNGYACFDFGRSSLDEGTYKFKKQWGAKPDPLRWHYVSLKGKAFNTETSEKSKFDKAIHYWQKLPVSITKIIGPPIRKHIGL